MNLTPIEWTDYSANPLKFRDPDGKVVWACVHASPGCMHCYSETLAKRYGRGGPFTVPTMAKLTPFLDEKELRAMVRCAEASGKRCFPFDMTDIFGDWVPDGLLHQVFANVLEFRRDVTWQLLTKRAERMKDYLTWRYKSRLVPRHIWFGVSVESQGWLSRIDALKDTPAAVRFVSFEPLLEDLGAVLLDGIDWAIIGGESGAQSRLCSVAWIRSLVRLCRRQHVKVFVKQLGSHVIDRNDAGFEGDPGDSWNPTTRYDELTGQGWQGDPVRIRLKSRKGGAMDEWPTDLRIREYPTAACRRQWEGR